MTVVADRVRASEAAFGVAGVGCARCGATVERAGRHVAGVEDCQVNLARGRAVVTFHPEQTNPIQIASAISASGYHATPEGETDPATAESQRLHHQRDHARAWLRRAVSALLLWFPVE